MRAFILQILFFLIVQNLSYGQIDSTEIFLKSKGFLEYPIKNITNLETLDDFKTLDHFIPEPNRISFTANSSLPVFAVYDGEVIWNRPIDSMYVLITKFGDYYLTYAGLKKPIVRIGSFIKAGQVIALVEKDFDDIFRLDIYLSNNSKNINPYPWFKHTSCP